MTGRRLRALVADGDPAVRKLLRRLLHKERRFRLVGEAADGREAVALIRERSPDLALLDARLPGLDAFEALNILQIDAPPAVIFTGDDGGQAARAFAARAVDYLLKPIVPERFREALERARDRLDSGAETASSPARQTDGVALIVVRSGSRRRLLAREEIHYILADNADAKLFTAGGSLLVNESLGSLERRLAPAHFVRVSRSALINLAHVTALEAKSHGDQFVTLAGSTRLTVTRTRRAALLARLPSG